MPSTLHLRVHIVLERIHRTVYRQQYVSVIFHWIASRVVDTDYFGVQEQGQVVSNDLLVAVVVGLHTQQWSIRPPWITVRLLEGREASEYLFTHTVDRFVSVDTETLVLSTENNV